MNIPIVAIAFNREHSLRRLLTSLLKAHYPESQKIIISVDGNGSGEVIQLVEQFAWPFGEKELILHDKNMGLRNHILFCGSLSQNYDGVILLEEDLFVSPWFYDYAVKAATFYRDCRTICGIALYSHSYNETACFPFQPLHDASDTYFMQLACSWGQLFLREQWAEFNNWYQENSTLDLSKDPSLPVDITKYWPSTSWKKFFIKFMLEQEKFFVYPKNSYTTNFGDTGQHHINSTLFQVPIVLEKKSLHFKNFSESYAKYDVFCEILPESLKHLCNELQQYDFIVDLYGVKSNQNLFKKYVITSKKCKKNITSFGRELIPLESNIIYNIPGNDLFLSATDDVWHYKDIDIHRFETAQDFNEQLYHYNIAMLHYDRFNEKIENCQNRLTGAELRLLETTRTLQEKERVLELISNSHLYRIGNRVTKSFHFLKRLWRK